MHRASWFSATPTEGQSSRAGGERSKQRLRARKLKNSYSSQRAWRGNAALFLLMPVLLVLAAGPALAGSHRTEAWARSQFATAERMRDALHARPAADRTRHDYQQAIDAYRRVYYGSPTSTKADPSVVAVAELMVEMGERLDDDDILRKAIRQYEFLRREYPGSKNRSDALFAIGKIYQDDLDDPQQARTAFQEFLRRYPGSHLADDARKSLAGDAPQVVGKVEAGRDAEETPPDSREGSGKASSGSEPGGEAAGEGEKLLHVTGIRHWSTPDYTRVAIDLEQDVKFESQRIGSPDRIFFDLLDTKLAATLVGKTFDVEDGFLRKIRVAQFERGRTRVVLEVDDLSDYNAFLLPNPPRLIIDIHGKPEANPRTAQAAPAATSQLAKSEPMPAGSAKADAEPELSAGVASNSGFKNNGVKKKIVEADSNDEDPMAEANPAETKRVGKAAVTSASERSKVRLTRSAREAQPMAKGDRSLIRALGLKIGKIVIDPGHGGFDTGTIGPNGLLEKDLVLDVSRRLGKLLEARLGAEVDYTRRDDTFIPLETRTAIANQDQADLFISVHANSSRDPEARGVETYYLNFSSSAEALEVAARENAVSEKSIHELQDLVKKIALQEKIDESREFATDVESALHSGLALKNPGLRDRGVKKAPFIVLIGANMPSILAEVSFVSNPGDERRLETSEFRQRIAESLYRGIAKYVGGLSGVKVASKIEKTAGP
jgi:N-acetylmuramoyl-L-alanine amidase